MNAGAEIWRDLPGYSGFYQVSTLGGIRSFRDPHHKGARLKTPVTIKPTRGRYNTHFVIKWEGKQKTIQVGKAVALTFIGPIPKGAVAYHKDGDVENNALKNIGIGPRAELSRKRMRDKTAGKNRRPVLKLDRSLTVIEAYPSSVAAAKANGFRQDAMWRFCTLAIDFSVFAPDDFLYTFDDDKWMRKALRRAIAELDAMGARYNDPFTEQYYALEPDPEPEITGPLEFFEAPVIAGGLDIRNFYFCEGSVRA